MYIDEEEHPKVFNAWHVACAVGLHLLIFSGIWYIGILVAAPPKEEIIPIECLVVVHENLDGDENEPPPESEPVAQPDPPPPDPPQQTDPPPQPDPQPPPPPPPEDTLVIPEKEKPKPPEVKPEPPKPPEVKPPQPTPEEIARKKKEEAEKKKQEREERMRKMRESMVKNTNTKPPVNNGKTDKRPPNWEKLLNEGYKPANRNQGLDASEDSRCIGFIKAAFYEKWNPRPPWNDQLRKMKLQISFDKGGQVTGYRLTGTSGDPSADATVISAAKRVSRVAGLTSSFLERNPTVTIEFEVTP